MRRMVRRSERIHNHAMMKNLHRALLISRAAVCIALTLTGGSVAAGQGDAVAVFVKAPRTRADPRAKVVADLLDIFAHDFKRRIRVVATAGEAQFVIDPQRPYITGTPMPYVVAGAGEDRITAAPLHVVGARVCPAASDRCTAVTASARVNAMAMLQLGEQIAKAVRAPAR